MPAEGIHLTSLREAATSAQLDASARVFVVRHDDAARLGALLVDLSYFDRFAGEVIRYVARRPPRPSPWGARLHQGGAVELLDAMLEVARQDREGTTAAIALGLASHLAIDRALHPLVNALARRHRGGIDHDTSHREVEKFQSICFHEQYMGRDLMGTDPLRHLLAVQRIERLGDREVARPVLAAFARAFGAAALTPAELARWGRGYRSHVWLLGTPLARRIAPPAAKDAARPLYLHGAWGEFASHLAAAIAESIRVINAAAAVLDASDRDLPAARAALSRVLPPGTIDPQGDELDLEAPVAIALAR